MKTITTYILPIIKVLGTYTELLRYFLHELKNNTHIFCEKKKSLIFFYLPVPEVSLQLVTIFLH